MAPRPGVTRERVIDAAAEAIDAGGLESLSLARLAEALGVRTPSLYNHIGGLDDLRGALRLRGLEALESRLQRAAVGRAGRDALRALAEAYRAFAHEHPGLYPLTLGAGGNEREGVRDAAAAEAAASRIVEVVLRVLSGYRLEGDDALHATRVLRSSLHGFVSLENSGGFGLPLALDESFRRLVDMHDAAMRSAGGS
ncbi:MAG: TetR-like C-terminal domain-containing protein [Deinococcales bacterium]